MTNKVSEGLIQKLEKEILSGKYKPGGRFPSERELAGRFNVSRSTVRESLQRLSQLGLLETRPQSGSVVSDYNTEASLDLLVHIMKSGAEIDPNTLVSLMEFRRVIEVHAARKAAGLATEVDIEALRLIVESEERHGADPAAVGNCDYQLHRLIIAVSGNLVTRLVFNSFKPVYRFFTDAFFKIPDTIAMTHRQHRSFLEAFERKDADAAATVMEDMLVYGEMKVKKALGMPIAPAREE